MSDMPYVAGDELTQVLQDAANTGRRFRLVAGSRTYLVRVDPNTLRADAQRDPFENYDPEAVREALHASFGILKGVDVEALLKDLRAQRGHVVAADHV